jgi:hypothetical protein
MAKKLYERGPSMKMADHQAVRPSDFHRSMESARRAEARREGSIQAKQALARSERARKFPTPGPKGKFE